MQPHEVDIFCPICDQKVRLNRLTRHRNRRHKDISVAEFERIVSKHQADGTLKVDTRRASIPGTVNSATQAWAAARKQGKKMAKKVSGGAFGMGKRR